MALCKEPSRIGISKALVFDTPIRVGTEVRYEVIYRCMGCAVEVAALGGRPFPSPRQHPPTGGCREQRWQLLVAATPYSAGESDALQSFSGAVGQR
ncbi:hypothetical protein RCH10_004509 [Variovorax sp. GrIS 2.14]